MPVESLVEVLQSLQKSFEHITPGQKVYSLPQLFHELGLVEELLLLEKELVLFL